MESLRANIIRKRVMRRVWGHYAKQVVLSVWTFHGLVLGLSATALWQLVSVPNIIWNLLNTAVKDVPGAVMLMLLEGEALVVFILFVTIVSTIAFIWRWPSFLRASRELRHYYGRDTAWS